MADPILSPDGKFMWTGTEWVPNNIVKSTSLISDTVVQGDLISNFETQESQNLAISDSVIMGDVIQSTTVLTYDSDNMKSMIYSVLSEIGLNSLENVFDFRESRTSNLLPIQKQKIEQVMDIVESVKPNNEEHINPELEYELASASFAIGKNEESLSHLMKALKIHHKNGNLQGLCRIYDALGQYFTRIGNYFKAKQMFDSALQSAISIGDTEMKIVYSFYSYNVLTSTGDHDLKKSSKILNKIYASSKKHSFSQKNQWVESAILRSMLSYIDVQKSKKKALKIIDKANLIDISNNDQSGIAKNFRSLGEIMLRNDEIIQGIQQFKKAAHIENSLGDLLGEAHSLRKIAAAYTLRRDIREASNFYQQSLKIFETLGEKKQVATTLMDIGFLFGMSGDYVSSENYARESLQIFRDINSHFGEMRALEVIGKSFESRGDYSNAKYYYSEKDRISSELNF
jgi:tetratricopeptide (TPR) repeat protein